ncbi:hypothetical protein Scep_019126 [Stephania cephalantha]|uniref:Uncharacterized protein n=1 Tax=Stephania cephalantha TaxID=152367 RepID=A0AAP0NL01_9MAGN
MVLPKDQKCNFGKTKHNIQSKQHVFRNYYGVIESLASDIQGRIKAALALKPGEGESS